MFVLFSGTNQQQAGSSAVTAVHLVQHGEMSPVADDPVSFYSRLAVNRITAVSQAASVISLPITSLQPELVLKFHRL